MNHALDEITKRRAMAERCLAIFKEWLEPREWSACVRGEDDPDSFCDSNWAVHQAYQETFGEFPNGIAESPLEFARWNAAVRLATRLLVGDVVSPVEMAREVDADDSHGLQIVGGGRRLRAVVAQFLS